MFARLKWNNVEILQISCEYIRQGRTVCDVLLQYKLCVSNLTTPIYISFANNLALKLTATISTLSNIKSNLVWLKISLNFTKVQKYYSRYSNKIEIACFYGTDYANVRGNYV